MSTQADMHMAADKVYVCAEVFYISGWMLDSGNTESVEIRFSSTKKTAVRSNHISRIAREDILKAYQMEDLSHKAGFVAVFPFNDDVKCLSDLKDCELFVENEESTVSAKPSQFFELHDSPEEVLGQVTQAWDPGNELDRNSTDIFIAPLFRELFPVDRKYKVQRVDFGEATQRPNATIIVPLYGRFDFMRYQLSKLSRLETLKNAELIYVVDDPAIRDRVVEDSEVLYSTFRLPFSLVLLDENMGFAGANNIGVDHARSENLVLMNSDVLPCEPDWLDRLIAALNEENDTGIVGLRLIYEDGSIQHDGMTPMKISEYESLLFNDHPGKGFYATDPNAEERIDYCALLTAACMAIKKDLFSELGGFAPEYILGDFEDSDLCLKALAKGKKNKLLRLPNIYHLERQSQNLVGDLGWKHKVTLYNAITYNQRWAKNLKTIFPNIC